MNLRIGMLYLTAKTGLLTQEDGDEGVGREEEEKRQRNLYFNQAQSPVSRFPFLH
jgi:hypothetical protein